MGCRTAAADQATASCTVRRQVEPLARPAASAATKASPAPVLSTTGTEGAGTCLTTSPVAPEMLKAVFQAPRPSAAGKVSAGTTTLASGDQAVFVISAVHPGNVPQQLAAQPDLAQRISQQSAIGEVESYVADLQRTAKIKKNEKIFANE